MTLQFPAQIFKNQVADERGDESDGEVRDGEDIDERRRHGLVVAVGRGELPHQQIRVKEKVDKANLDHRPPDGGETPICPLALHGDSIVQRANKVLVRAAGLTLLGRGH